MDDFRSCFETKGILNRVALDEKHNMIIKRNRGTSQVIWLCRLIPNQNVHYICILFTPKKCKLIIGYGAFWYFCADVAYYIRPK